MKKCTINIGEKDYELVLTRNAIKWLENRGITLDTIDKKLLTFVDGMWVALFIANYSDMSETDCIALLEQYESEGGDVSEIVKFAVDEYTAFINALSGTKSKTKKKKAQITKA